MRMLRCPDAIVASLLQGDCQLGRRHGILSSFGLAEDLDRLKRLRDRGVARVVPMFPPEKSDKVLPIIDRWTKLMGQVNT